MTFSSQIDAFSPSQDAADDSTTTPSKFQGASGTTPLTVKQIADAQLAGTGEKGAPFVVDGVETDNIRVVGMVSGKAERATDVSFTLDHGTGRIDFIKWVNDAADSAETAAIQNGTYVSVIGTLKGLQDKKHATAFCVRPVTDYNEVPMHFTQCLRMHIVNTKSKVGSPAQTAGTPFSNNLSEASAPTSLKSNPPPVTSGTYGSWSDLCMRVLNVFSEPASIESDHGVHIHEIAKQLRLPAGKIEEVIEFHANCGHIYSMIDEFHYKSAFIDRVCNPPPVISGTNGSGNDLYTQVLNVFSEPAGIESDHGVHIDEIAKRLTLPTGKIKEAIEFHVNCGNIFSMADDFHYKSAFIDRVCNPPTVTSGTNGSETDLFTQVLNVFSEPASIESDHGVHIDEIAKRLTLPAGKIREAIEFHVNCGHIFSTIDDFHYKSAFIDRVCNPPTVTSGTNGSETDLFTQVLNVFSEPASIESDHGVHIDEIAKRLTLPAGKIREAIEFHVNCGHIFSTIDDFHYKSAFIDQVCNPPTVTSGTNGSETDLFTQVLNVFSEPASIESDHGVHIDEIAKRLTLPAGKIREAIEFHVNCGHIFSTIDDFHYKSAFIDRVCNPPTVTSITNGSETDLFTRVLNVFSEPASIESDHGVHIDEIAKRLTLPAGKIREAIEFHVNCGHIFSTIDDFHYKSAFIDRVCNPPTVTSGTNGSETDLFTQVLNVFSEPASIESDHGVHIDEIAKRLTLPAGKIREAIEFHVNCGHIFSTIDDFYYKSAFNDRVCNPPTVTSETNGSETDLFTQVLNVFSEPASIESDHGVHIDEIAKRLTLPAGKIREAIEFHVNCGHIFSTIDDFHYKSAFIDRVCNPPTVTSGTNGSETDLFTQVLNVFSEPASIESDHGVHIDEIAKRLTLPAGKIREAIEFHVNCGHIFSTIDDFHYKSAFIDRVCNPPTVTSGTNGSETDLFTQVLNVFSEPASIESDHGLHIDEIAMRLKLPAGKIREAINFLVDCGRICSTIDDFHYKSAFVD